MLNVKFLPSGLVAAVVVVSVIAAARPASAFVPISGRVFHCDGGSRSVDLGDQVRVTDGARTYTATLNSDGSFTVVVEAAREFTLFVYSSGRAAPVWRQRIVATGDQPPICIPKASP